MSDLCKTRDLLVHMGSHVVKMGLFLIYTSATLFDFSENLVFVFFPFLAFLEKRKTLWCIEHLRTYLCGYSVQHH